MFGLFGGQSSSSSSKTFLRDVSKVLTDSVNKCTGSMTVSQKIDIDGNYNITDGVSMKNMQVMKITCVQDAATIAKMQSEVENAIKQKAAAQGEALMSALQSQSSVTDSDIHQDVEKAITVNSINDMMVSAAAAQSLDVHGNYNITRNISYENSQKILASTAQKIISSMTSVSKIMNAIDQQSSTKLNNPISEIIKSIGDAITSVWDSFSAPVKWIIVLIIIVAVAYLYTTMGTDAAPPPPGVLIDQAKVAIDESRYKNPTPIV